MAKKKDKKTPEINPLQRLRNFFKLGISPSAEKEGDQVYPTKKKLKDLKNNEDIKFVREKFPDEVQKLYDWYISTTTTKKEDYKNRIALWNDMYLLDLNSPHVHRAIETIVDEIIQVDVGSKDSIKVESPDKEQKKHVLELFDKVQLYHKIRPLAVNLVKYGNALAVLGFDDNGVSSVNLVDIFEFKERLEFSAYKVEQDMQNQDKNKSNYMFDYFSSNNRIQGLLDSMKNKDNIETYYKHYLLGYVVSNNVLPPWRALHFRNMTTDCPFWPFGMPQFINSLAPYNEYKAGKTIAQIAKGMSFPRYVYKINAGKNASHVEKMRRAAEIANLVQNSGLEGIKKEEMGWGETIYTIADLYEFEVQSPDVEVDKLGDNKEALDEVIVSTMLPRNLIDPNESDFGDSGVSLAEKWKPFARLVYRYQMIMLEQFINLAKIDMIQSKKWKEDEIDITLSMPYPESITNNDIIDNQESLFNLANNVIEGFSDKFFGGDSIPKEVAMDIYSYFLPYDDKIKDTWFKNLDKGLVDDEPEEDDVEENKEKKKDKLTEKFKNRRLYKEELNKIIYKEQSQKREGFTKGYHFYSSKNNHEYLYLDSLVKSKYQKKSKLNEYKENENE
jgi:hypothetical protein